MPTITISFSKLISALSELTKLGSHVFASSERADVTFLENITMLVTKVCLRMINILGNRLKKIKSNFFSLFLKTPFFSVGTLQKLS